VIGCEQRGEYWAVTLDATAFYPEGGGQAGDTGFLNDVTVLDTREEGEQILHFCDAPLEVGTQVNGRLDWDARFARMQNHTGEHMVSGVIHRRYGFHNVGFHMGSEIVTIDFDGMVPPEAFPEIEAEVNRAIWEDLPVNTSIPSPEELPHAVYRSKRALPWPVRIVEMSGIDSCACCGVHVATTGQVGLVKLISCIKFHQGVRIEMLCGKSAMAYLNRIVAQNRLVSQAFSAPMESTGEAAQRMNELLAAEKYRAAQLEKRLLCKIAESYVNCGDVLHFEDGLSSASLRELAEAISRVCGGRAAVFSGTEGNYGYCLAQPGGDLRAFGKDMNAVLNGRGGGKPEFQQGSVKATRQEIEAFFSDNGKE
jgi:alanyl-tRNA synthetase